jgi:hypothetical protein
MNTNMVTTMYRKRCRDGAAFLDERRPGWADEIDLESLRMESSCHCILGQLEGNFHDGMDELSIYEPEDYGFDLSDVSMNDDDSAIRHWEILDRVWIQLVRVRQTKASADA